MTVLILELGSINHDGRRVRGPRLRPPSIALLTDFLLDLLERSNSTPDLLVPPDRQDLFSSVDTEHPEPFRVVVQSDGGVRVEEVVGSEVFPGLVVVPKRSRSELDYGCRSERKVMRSVNRR